MIDNYKFLYIVAILFLTYTMFFKIKENFFGLGAVTTNVSSTDSSIKDTQKNISSSTNIDKKNLTNVLLNKSYSSTDLGMSDTIFNNVKNICESKTDQKNILNIIGSDVVKLTTKQSNKAKNVCILKNSISNASDTKAQNAILSSLANTLGVSATTANENLAKQDITSKNEATAESKSTAAKVL